MYLKNKRFYLSGAIEHSIGINWRTPIVDRLTNEFGIDVFDPFSDPKQQMADELRQARVNKDYKKMSEIAHNFVRKDMAEIDHSHVLVAYLEHKVPTVGVVHEIISSNNAKKPTLLVTNCTDISEISLWYYGFVPVEFMFAGWGNLFTYLKEVDEGKHKQNNRWKYTYGLV